MNPPPISNFPTPRQSAASGAIFCLIAALSYTATNICMRRLTALHCDPFWVVFNKEVLTSLCIAPWVVWQVYRGRSRLPSRRTLWAILAIGLLVQLAGNVGVQWALGIVGLAVTIPAIFGLMILGGAVLGRFWLGERISARSAVAMTVLLASIVLLGFGAPAVGASVAGDGVRPALSWIVLAVGASCLAGAIYALLCTFIRHAVTQTTTPTAIGMLVPLTAVISLGPICVYRLGVSGILDTSLEQLLFMVAAGLCNTIGFLGLIHGLKRTSVVHANVVTASQVAMASVAGMVLFGESFSAWILTGIVLTIFGIVWIDRPAEALDEIPPP